VRLANLNGRLTALSGQGGIDIEDATGGDFSQDVFAALQRWDELAAAIDGVAPTTIVDPALLGPPVPLPRQVFAIGLNYRDHAVEAGTTIPDTPPVFTKFPTCTAGPCETVALPSSAVDYEVELVVVIGTEATRVRREDAWNYIAGYMVGQDLSERSVQLAGPVPQFSLGKSFSGFGPTGPAIVGLEELGDPDALQISCSIGEDVRQNGSTADMIFDVRDLVVRLSAVCRLLPGDLIFTGTPAGVGLGCDPPRFLKPGEVLTSCIETVGEIHTTFTAGPSHFQTT
jgi:2,4-diketo-3-deoxy-L-fuconate hydrolase